MSENRDVNVNDHSQDKISLDKKIFNDNENAAETETRTEESGSEAMAAGATRSEADSSATSPDGNISNVNTEEDAEVDAKDSSSNNLSNEEPNEYSEETAAKEREQGPSLSEDKIHDQFEDKPGESQSEPDGAVVKVAELGKEEINDDTNLEEESLGVKMNIQLEEANQSVTDGAVMEVAELGKKEINDGTNLEEESQELKMNIQLEEPNQSVTGRNPTNCVFPIKDSSQQGNQNKEQADNTEKEHVTEEKVMSEEAGESCPKGNNSPTEVDEHSDKAEGEDCPNEKGKSDSENEGDDSDITASRPEDPLLEKAESKKSNIDRAESNITNTDRSDKDKKDNEMSELNASAGDSKGKKNTEEDHKPAQAPPLSRRLARMRQSWSEYDTLMYRLGYPDKPDDPALTKNLDFYQGRIVCEPDKMHIDDIHELWWDDHIKLESRHGYIQWLFPIRESGMNWQAQELQLHEAVAMEADEAVMTRVIKSYEMMLSFYGICLISVETGEVERAGNCLERFEHLNFSMHNFLRITRILKCLGELGLERYKAPFLRFMLHEAIVTRELNRTLSSCYNYWIGTVRDDKEREDIENEANMLCLAEEQQEERKKKSSKFPWCPC